MLFKFISYKDKDLLKQKSYHIEELPAQNTVKNKHVYACSIFHLNLGND